MFSKAYTRYVLGSLTLVLTLNFLDRALIGLLLQPIKEDLHLSDTQLGFVTGIAFALFYATLGLPVARWADRGNRVTITSIAIGLWGLTVMACLLVTNFVQLVLARIAAAVGESGCMPPTYSLLADYFTEPAERTRAMTAYWLASPFATVISFMLGGWLNELYGWRITFFVMGLPALLVAALVKLTIAEPRVRANRLNAPGQRYPRMADVLLTLWHQRSTRHLSIAIVLLWMIGLGLGSWFAAFMIRTHGMGTAELGIWLGLICGLSQIAGLVLGGYVAGRWFEHNEQGQMRLSAVVIASLVPWYVLFLLLPNKHHALFAMVPVQISFIFTFGPTFALMQRLVVDEMRASMLAVVMLLANLIGMGVGPQIVGIISDLFMPVLGKDSLRYAMLVMSLISLWAAYHFWQVGRTVKQDLVATTQVSANLADAKIA
jgi:MFS family permease